MAGPSWVCEMPDWVYSLASVKFAEKVPPNGARQRSSPSARAALPAQKAMAAAMARL